jgi:hypothetical protein
VCLLHGVCSPFPCWSCYFVAFAARTIVPSQRIAFSIGQRALFSAPSRHSQQHFCQGPDLVVGQSTEKVDCPFDPRSMTDIAAGIAPALTFELEFNLMGDYQRKQCLGMRSNAIGIRGQQLHLLPDSFIRFVCGLMRVLDERMEGL